MAFKRGTSANFTIFFMQLLGLWYPTNKNDKSPSNMLLGVFSSTLFFCAFVQIQEIYFKRDNSTLLTYVAPCAVLVISEMTKLPVFVFKRDKVDTLNEHVDLNFWQRRYSEEEMKIVNKCDKLCCKATITYIIVLLVTTSHYLIEPIVEILLSDSMGTNISDRKLPFPIHLTQLVYQSPYYQMTYVCQVFCTLGVTLSAITFASYLFVVNLYSAAQFRILGMRLRAICDFEDIRHQVAALRKLKQCVIEHQALINFTDQVDSLFCYVMLGQVFVSVSLISCCGLQILLSGGRILQQSLSGLGFLTGSFAQLYLYCYSAYEIYTSSESISQALYFMNWFQITDSSISKEFAQILRIINLRANRPCVLTVGKFYPLTLESFAAVTKTSVSYFTVLRQIVK